ncbi:MAG: HlyD family type I secretion periplasmic adaptor subunit [Alphaproteobacteria bacterium]|nr:HlyD family type I secretion periplasmic adaptor subunit [Alphaproteobacteria bacterium]
MSKTQMQKAVPSRPFPLLPMVLGLSTCAVFTITMLAWLGAAPLSSAVIAGGIVSVESYRKAVQHLEGGIVDAILVRDGDMVEAGDVLVELQQVAASADVDRIRTQYFEALANVARLEAEREGANIVTFPSNLADNPHPLAKAAMAGQQKVFLSRVKLHKETFSVLDQKIAQLTEQKRGLAGQLAATRQQIVLFAEERKDMETLYKKKLLRKSRYLELQRRQAELDGKQSELEAGISEAEQEVLELELKKQELRTSTLATVTAEHNAQQARSYELSRELAAKADVLARSQIRSPISGTVVNLQIHSKDGVIAPGQTLLEIVPESDTLIVEARVRPEDIEEVHAGQSANVILTTFNRRFGRPLPGKLESVSADRLTDDLTGQPYYLVRVGLDKRAAETDRIKVMAGMGADVFIQTGERTPLQYIAGPILKTFMRGMREN